MTAADLIAKVIVFFFIFLIISLLTFIYHKITEKNFSWKKLLISVALSLVIGGIGGVIIQHIQNAVNKVSDAAIDVIAEAIQVSMDIIADMASSDTEITDFFDADGEKESDSISEDEHPDVESAEASEEKEEHAVISDDRYPNRIDVSLSIENRVLVPEWSVYPSENMVAEEILDNHRDENGYKGRARPAGSITSSFTADKDDLTGLFNELEVEILHNPYVADMIAQEIAPYYPDEEWLQEFKGKSDASLELPYFSDGPFGMEIWYASYEFSDGQSGTYVTDEYRNYAEQMCKFLETFENLGVMTPKVRVTYSSEFRVFYESRPNRVEYEPMEWEAMILRKDNLTIGFVLDDKALILCEDQ